MTGVHPELGDLGPELRKLARAVLDGIDPAVRAAAMLAANDRPGKCQQVWCPVCALVALVTGEEHPLLTVIAEHSTALLAVIRAAADGAGEPDGPGEPDGAAPSPPARGASEGASDEPGGPVTKSSYQRIPVTIEE